MPILDGRRQEFLAKIGYFFERYPLMVRWNLPSVGIGLLVWAVLIHPREKTG